MPKRSDLLDRINIASPCSADWDEMFGNEQVRFCRDCSLYVHDLSKVTRKDAVKLVAASKGKLCVRYYRHPDGTLSTASRAEPLRRIKRRLSRLAAGAFTASLSLASNVAGQSTMTEQSSPSAIVRPEIIRDRDRAFNSGERTGGVATLAGTVFDPAQAVVAGAKVTLINMKTEQEQNIECDEAGVYEFKGVEAGTYVLRIESPGFAVFQRAHIILQSGEDERIDATLDVGMLSGVVVVMPDTPLVNAIWNEKLDDVRALLAEGVDVNLLDKNTNSTALGEAVGAGNLDLVRMLLGAGADVNMRNNEGQTALMRLDEDATVEIVRALVDAGAKVNLKDEEGESALLVAAALEKTELLQSLLEAGAKVNTKNKEGKTALMIAAEEGHVENVKALLRAGADVGLKTKEGETALKYARESEALEIVAALLAQGAVD
jgi:hypothetical protein